MDDTIFPKEGTVFPREGTFFPREGTFFPREDTFFPREGTFFSRKGTFFLREGILLLMMVSFFLKTILRSVYYVTKQMANGSIIKTLSVQIISLPISLPQCKK